MSAWYWMFLVVAAAAVAEAQETTDSPYTLSDFSGVRNPTKENKLPDLGNPKVIKALGCSVCRGVVSDFREIALKRLARLGKKRLSELDVAEITDGFCERVAKEYNLMTLDNMPQFKDAEKRSEHGYWVSQFFENRCSELLDQREQEFITYFKEEPDQFLARICNDCDWKYNPGVPPPELPKPVPSSQESSTPDL